MTAALAAALSVTGVGADWVIVGCEPRPKSGGAADNRRVEAFAASRTPAAGCSAECGPRTLACPGMPGGAWPRVNFVRSLASPCQAWKSNDGGCYLVPDREAGLTRGDKWLQSVPMIEVPARLTAPVESSATAQVTSQ